MAVGELLEIGGQRQHLDALRAKFIGQLVDQFGAVDQQQSAALLSHAFGHAPADALGGASDHGDLVVKTCVHLSNLLHARVAVGVAARTPTLRAADQALAANFS